MKMKRSARLFAAALVAGIFQSQTSLAQTNPMVEAPTQERGEASVEGEVANLDQDGFMEEEHQAMTESKALEKEVRTLEKKVASMKSGAERAQKQAELARKRLDLERQKQKEAHQKASLAEREKSKADLKLKAVRDQVKAAEQIVQDAKHKNAETISQIRQTEKENTQLQRRLEIARKVIAQEMKRGASLRSKSGQLLKENKRLKDQISRAERGRSKTAI